MNKAKVINQIDHLIETCKNEGEQKWSYSVVAGNVYTGILTLSEHIYGRSSTHVLELQAERKRISEIPKSNEEFRSTTLVHRILGTLHRMKYDVENDIMRTVTDEARGEIYADFISLAKESLEKGSKDVAAMLACAALEDSLKKFSYTNGLDVDNADLSGVINALKSKGLLKKAELKVAQSYVTLRNKAFHAEWNKIGKPEISSCIGYVEGFVLSKF